MSDRAEQYVLFISIHEVLERRNYKLGNLVELGFAYWLQTGHIGKCKYSRSTSGMLDLYDGLYNTLTLLAKAWSIRKHILRLRHLSDNNFKGLYRGRVRFWSITVIFNAGHFNSLRRSVFL